MMKEYIDEAEKVLLDEAKAAKESEQQALEEIRKDKEKELDFTKRKRKVYEDNLFVLGLNFYYYISQVLIIKSRKLPMKYQRIFKKN